MASYIDAVKTAEIISDKLGIALSELVDVMATVPTADVQEVVRCKDCKNRKSSEFCECREPDAYCSDGERMDGEENA